MSEYQGNTEQHARSANRKLQVGLIAAIIVATVTLIGIGIVASGAWFTAQQQIEGNTIAAATSELIADGQPAGSVVKVAGLPIMSVEAATVDGDAGGAAEVELGVRNLGSNAVDWVVRMSAPTVLSSDDATVLDSGPVSVAYYDSIDSAWKSVSLQDFFADPPVVDLSGVDLAAGDQATFMLRFFASDSAGDEYENASITFTAENVAVEG
ncbi:hypothetical protein FHX49_002003 [Microbacterium endophyticum]|uniref:Uncharacterized protein n=1 Tax=Microbacterium endophyticum TaxID=1526412 RepID=A0A7W4V567_9MICO|nr:hypothetical protein [Microbacterium endophyticum]MBB2976428.1 hypothetical protein [Microbacterium endophyticum]NIK35874.1 hypothetical protein [Microbacterium endophyticum]